MVRAKKNRRFPFGWAGWLLVVLVGTFLGYLLQIYLQLPDVGNIDSFAPFVSTEIFSADGKVLASLHQEEDRIVVPLSAISHHLQKAVVVAEDIRFYRHRGVDLKGILRAVLTNAFGGGIFQGGSTITQQLARGLFLAPDRTLTRKIAEIMLALKIERRYTKEEILELYLNQVYWGHNTYGGEAAAQIYFGKHAARLTLPEAAMLAGITGGPELYSPYKNFREAKVHQALVLDRMAESGVISRRQAEDAKEIPLRLSMVRMNRYRYTAPYFTSYVIQQLIARYGEEAVYQGGLRITTTLNSKWQKAAENAVEKFIGRDGKLYRFSQAAMVAVDPRTGYIKALVGGADFDRSEYNRVTQAKRQTGSAFKPFVYTAAMEKGISPGDILLDTPISYPAQSGRWKPLNFDRRFRGPVTVTRALELSLNIPSIRLLEKVGISAAIDVARRLGIRSELGQNLSLTLGTSELSLLEMTSAFGVFAARGIRTEPISILKVERHDGTLLFEAKPKGQRVLDANIADTMAYLMQGVIQRGTGVMGNIGRPAAAKTGTTENYRDAWFIGYVPQLVAGVWVGNDDNVPMRGVAEVAVCPRLWKAFMHTALAKEPVINFSRPRGLVNVRICVDSQALPTENCPPRRIRTALFWAKGVPKVHCERHRSARVPPDWLKDLLVNPPVRPHDATGEVKTANPEGRE